VATALTAAGIVAVAAIPFPLPLRSTLGDSQTARQERAPESFGAAIRSDPSELPADFQRALLHWQRGDIGRALREFDQILRLKRREAELKVEEL
jgi:Tfp pilus assembly protein PilF